MDTQDQPTPGAVIRRPTLTLMTDSRWWRTIAETAAAIRYRLHSMDVVPPRWTVKEPLDKFWWPVHINLSREYNDWAHSPAELLCVGIFLDERDFTTA